MTASVGVLVFFVFTLSTNGKPSPPQKATETLSSSQKVDPYVNKNEPFDANSSALLDAHLHRLYVDEGYTDIPIFEKGFNLTEKEQEQFKIWPQGEIPYFIDELSFDLEQESNIIDILEKYSKVTGLDFIQIGEAPEEHDDVRWVLFANRKGHGPCVQYTVDNFTNTGMQRIIIGWHCISATSLAPLILTLAGIPPQHNSPNRDEYIEILWENIVPDKRQLFKKLSDSEWLFHNMEYDFSSAGHIPNHMYSINGNDTFNIIRMGVDDDVADRRFHGLSYRDIRKIKMMYNYISRNRTESLNQTRRNNDIGIDVVDDGLPRPKPNRYLGLPDPTTTTISTTTTTTRTTTQPEFKSSGRRKNKRGFNIKIPKGTFDDFIMFLK